MKKLFYVVLLSCVVSISFVGCGGSMKNVSFLEVSNEKVNKKMEKIDKTKFLNFKIEDNRIMFTPEDYKNNFNLIAESLNYNKMNEFTEGSFGDEYSPYTTHDFDLDENTKVRLLQPEGEIGYKIVAVEHTIQPEDADNNFLDFGNACFVSALACTNIENQEDLKANISQGLSDIVNNGKTEIPFNEEFEYGFELKDDIITFYAIVFAYMNNLNLENVTNEYPKIKTIEKIIEQKHTFLNKYEIKVTTDKKSLLNMYYIIMNYTFDAETSIEDKVKTVLFTVTEINQLFDESDTIRYSINCLEDSEYPNITASGKVIQPNDNTDKKLHWYVDDKTMSKADKKAILKQIDDIIDKWYSEAEQKTDLPSVAEESKEQENPPAKQEQNQTEAQQPEEAPQIKEYEFTAGFYTIGEDIPAGKYDVEWVSGLGVCNTGDMIEAFGDSYGHIKSFKNVTLKSGEEIEVTSTLKIKFIEK